MDHAAESRAEYDRRLHRVLSFIDARLAERLDLARVAREANFSAFHFHRIFTALTGETLASYVTRRRLEVAAARLISQPRLSVLAVALDVGFGSPEAFSRAFRKQFGCTPSVWKTHRRAGSPANSKMDQVHRKPDQAKGVPAGYSRDMATTKVRPLQVTVEKRPEVRVAYLRYQGPFGAAINAFWRDKVFPWLAASDLLAAPKYGISRDDPQVTAPEKCRYDAGAEVGKDFVPSAGARIDVVPGGLYARTRYKGQPRDMPATWDRLLREWLPESGYQLDNRPSFEYIGSDCGGDESTGECECDLCIPVAPL
jgi:AraC family transcriptional regulator